MCQEQIEPLVYRLRKRAEIRRKIRAEGDRIARDLDEAANRIEELENIVLELQEKYDDKTFVL